MFLLFTFFVIISCSDKKETYRIGISQSSSDAWSMQMNREMRREAWICKNVQLNIRTAQNDNNIQIRQIDSLVSEGIDLLVVSSSEAEELTSTIDSVMSLGIPVILTDRMMASTNHCTAYIGADNRSIGRDIGSFVVRELKGEGTLLELIGDHESTVASERHEGIKEVLKSRPNIHTIAMVEVGWEGPRIQQQIDSLFKHGVIPNLIIAPNDRVGVRVHDAIVRLGYPDIGVIGIDGLTGANGGLDNVEQGKLLASFLYPSGGDKVIQTAVRILSHEPYNRNILLRSAIINDATLRIFRMQRDQLKENEERINRLGTLVDKTLSRKTMQDMLLFACVVIIVLIGLVMIMGIRTYIITMRRNEELNKQKHKLEQQHKQMVKMQKGLEESTRSKLFFFSEVSHDLRTPLTLILAPTEQLLQNADQFTSEQRELLQMIQHNANTLLHLVQQMLDFRKFEEGNLKLVTSNVRINQELLQWCKPFEMLARKKMIRFNVVCQPTIHPNDYEACIDVRKMESVMYNILTNAFKYTPEGGKISVTCSIENSEENDDPHFILIVEDTGKGIDADKLPHIFERYYQADFHHDGSGIGLATVKALVELHGGSVKAESMVGEGSRFIVRIPTNQAQMGQVKTTLSDLNETTANTSAVGQTAPMNFAKVVIDDSGKTSEADSTPIVLVIDDNEDIRTYLRQLLKNEYVVEEASNGKEGIEKARQLIPDIVVCDIMMPVMGGLECCKHLKEEWQTSHIPVVLLTACALDEQRAIGFHCGANAYISKPFTPDMIRTRLRNIIDNHRRTKAFFSDKGVLRVSNLSLPDKNFSDRFRQVVEANLSSSDLSIEDIASQMGLGRTQLYRKIKQLTGLSPVEVVRTIRLKKAAELLTRTDKNISQIAFEVGFSSSSYLSKCFKDYFGVNPKEYK